MSLFPVNFAIVIRNARVRFLLLVVTSEMPTGVSSSDLYGSPGTLTLLEGNPQ